MIFPRAFLHLFLTLIILALTSSCADEAARLPTTDISEAEPPSRGKVDKGGLEPRLPVEGVLASGDATHVYHVELADDAVLHVRAEQEGVDLSVALVGTEGDLLREVDTLTGNQGPEDLWFLARRGTHRIEVTPLEGSGSYRLLCERRPPTSRELRPAEAQTAHLEGERLFRERDYDGAADAFRRARKLWKEAGLGRQEGLTLAELARAEVEAGRRTEGFAFYEEAVELFGNLSEPRQQVRVLNNWGLALRLAGNLEEAERRYEAALETARKVGHRAGEAAALGNLAMVDYWRGEAQDALIRNEQALEIRRELGQEREAAQILQNMASCYLLFERWDEALTALSQAHRTLKRREDHRLFNNLMTVGWYHYLRGESEGALRFYLWAERLTEKVSGHDTAGLLDRMGRVYTELGDWPRAEDAFMKARQILTAGGYLLGEAHTLANLCRLYVLSGDPETGETSCGQALTYFRRTGDVDGEAGVLYLSARLARHRGDLDRAREQARQAIDLLEELRAGLHAPLDRSSFLAGWLDYYELYLEVLMELCERDPDGGWERQVLAVIERTRARSLLELLAEAQVELRQGVDRRLLAEARRVRTQLEKTRRLALQPAEGSETEVLDQVLQQRLQLTQRYEELQRHIRRANPAAASLTRPQPLYLEEIQQLLDHGTLLLFYALGNEHSVLCLVGRSTLLVEELPPRREIEALARTWYELLSDPGKQWAGGQQNVVAASLSRMLLGKVADRLNGGRLVILGDGALRFLPFQALPHPSSGGEEPRLLLEDHEVAYLPSASTLAVLRQSFAGRRPAAGLLAVVADPIFDARDERFPQRAAGGVAGSPGEPRFQRLRHVKTEVNAILGVAPPGAPVALLEGFEANRDNVMSGRLENFRIIHFATHAVVDSFHPELSKIVLTQVDESGRERPGHLGLQDIYDLTLPAELVVLSACRTALGPEIRGEGLIGLTRGFMYAGAPRVLVSLWNVEDEATATLMERFYHALLRDKLAPAAALREAQLSIRREPRRHPYHWAGFVLQGEWVGFDVSVEETR